MSDANGHPPADRSERLERQIAELRRSRRRLIDRADADRREIERAMHDGVQQQLVAVAVELQQLRRLLDADPAGARSLLADLESITRDALDEAAALAQRIHPPLLDVHDPVGALRAAAASAGVRALVSVRAWTLPPDRALPAYWCWVEALSLAAPGTEAVVTLREGDTELTFEVLMAADDAAAAALESLRDRLEAFDGRLDVDVAPDGRRRVSGSFPLTDEASPLRPGT